MKKLLLVVVILNSVLFVPYLRNNWPVIMTQLRGDVRFRNAPDLNDLLVAFDWLKTKKEKKAIPHEAVVVCRNPQFCYYYTGLKSINFPFTVNKDSVFAAIVKADLILTDTFRKTSQFFLIPVLMDSAKYFRAVYSSGGTTPNVAILVVKKDELAKLSPQK